MTYDHLQAIFWSITYILLITYAIKFKARGIPLLAVCLNFSWETIAFIGSLRNARFSVPLLIHTAWFFLDLLIIYLYLFHETRFQDNKKEKLCFGCGYICVLLCLIPLFLNGYMLLSSFAIDLIMAIAFLRFLIVQNANINWILLFIGIFKLLGDIFAWLYYKFDPSVNIIGRVVLCCNIAYIIVLIAKMAHTPPKIKSCDELASSD